MATDPVSFAPIVEYDAEVIYMPHWKDASGAAIKNTADAPFPKPIVEPISIGIVHIWKWEASYTGATHKARLNKTNSGSWNGYAQDEAWVSRITAKEEEENGYQRWLVHYIIKCNPFGWKTLIPHMGYFYDDGDKKGFQTSDGFQYIGFLDGSGNETTSPVTSDFIIKGRTSFSFTGVI